MAKKQITAASSYEEKVLAANELRQAQIELSEWASAQGTKIDPQTGNTVQGFTYSEYVAQARFISQRYDYVDFGSQPSTNFSNEGPAEIGLGGSSESFYVAGIGSNPNSIPEQPASTVFEDQAVVSQPVETVNNTFNSANPSNPSNRTQNTSTVNTNQGNDLYSSGNVIPTDPAANRIEQNIPQPDPPPIQENTSVVTTPGVRYNNESTVNSSSVNTDDAGGSSGTGLDSGFASPSNSDIGSATVADNIDRDRLNLPYGEPGPNSEINSTRNISTVATVDQSGKTKVTDSGTGYETNSSKMLARQNILHNYANWTYNLSLYMVDPNAIESLANLNNVIGTSAATLLMTSGGKGSSNTNGVFSRDYYIDNLEFKSYVNEKAGTNFDLEFQVTEPYGVAFISELILLAQNKGLPDFIMIPYIIEIKFSGYDKDGRPAPELANVKKIIPIMITDITFKIDSAATVYTVKAIPFHHQPLLFSMNAKLVGSMKLIGETFEELVKNLEVIINKNYERAAEQGGWEGFDVIKFDILESDMAESKVGYDNKVEHVRKGMDPIGGPQLSKETIQIESDSLLKNTLLNILDTTDFGAKFNTRGFPGSQGDNKPLRVLKVIPVITKYTKYIPEQQRYAKEITYKIISENRYGYKIPGVANAPIGEQGRGWVKEYNWIFTGLNQDILRIDVDYNFMYQFAMSAYQDAKSRTLRVGNPSAESEPLPASDPARTRGYYSDVTMKQTSQPTSDKVSQKYRTQQHLFATDIMDHLFNNPYNSDLMTIDMDIVGDPDWIPQDSSVLGGTGVPSGEDGFANGSIAIDQNSTHVFLKFKTPRDYDDQSGLMKLESEQTFVQGSYRVISILNRFSDGKFTCTLDMSRDLNQNTNKSSTTGTLSSGLPDSNRPDLPPGQFADNTNVTINTPTTDLGGEGE